MANQTAGNVIWNFDVDNSGFQKGLSESSSEAKSFGNQLDNVSSGPVNSFSNAIKSVANVSFHAFQAGAVGIGTALITLGVKGITSASQLQSLQISMQGLTGSMKDASAAMAGAYAYAQKAPFQLPDVAATTKTLIAYGETAAQAVKDLDLLGNVSITSGIPIQAIGSIFGQVGAQGKLMLGDIRQLTQDGVAILPALQKQLGKTADQVQQMATDGSISFDMFRTAMSSLVDPHILDLLTNTLPRQIDRLGGSLRILSNAFVGVGVDAVNGFTMASGGIDQAITTLVKTVADTLRSPTIVAAATQIGTAIVPIINAITKSIEPIVSLIAKVTAGFSTLGAGAIPILGIIAAGLGKFGSGIPVIGEYLRLLDGPLAIIITLVTTLIASSPELKAAFVGAFNIIANALKPLAPIIQQIVSTFTGLLSIIGSALAPVVTAIAQSFAQILAAVAPLIPTLLNFVTIFVSNLVPIFQLIIPLIQGLTSILIAGLTPIITALIPVIDSISRTFGILASTLVNALTPVIATLTPILVSLATTIGTVLGSILTALAPVIDQLVVLFGQVLQQAIIALVPLFKQMGPVIQQVVTLLGQAFVSVLQALIPLLPSIADLISGLIKAYAQLYTALLPLVPVLIKFAVDVIEKLFIPVLKALMPVFPILIKAFLSILDAVIGLIPPFVTIASTILQALIPVLPILANAFIEIINAILPLIPILINALVPILPQLANAFIQILMALLPILPPLLQLVILLLPPLVGLLSAAIQVVVFLANAWFAILIPALTVGIRLFADLITWVTNIIVWIVQLDVAIVTHIAHFVASIGSGIGNAIQWFKDLPGRIISAIGDAGSMLANIGGKIIDGLVNGIKTGFNKVKDAMGDLTKKIASWKGPASLDKVLLAPNAKIIIDGFVSGLESNYGKVKDSLQGFTNDLALSTSITPNLSNDSTAFGGPKQQAATTVINQTNNIYSPQDMNTALNDLAWRIQN
jgi:tape measure domain-containing protein